MGDIAKLISKNRKMISRWKEIAEDGPDGNEPLGAVIRALEKTTEALASQPPTFPITVPEGWQIVPKILTPEMSVQLNLTGTFSDAAMQVRYAAALAVAPTP